ncbi:hypothetical protein BAUCODRAFT_37871 [Baudoinia panamericana UAMH 10762]|uniref:Uncharacterized protein n=1 Tax=Baudoinia panamericana (strain UAMH 10762) TaxID=717646 RepID=M2LFZ9_BAUPA|nr:uncharacterized protein BAUCODRAFT_37871 [Baudoinia panamericana UAMH 10762]EMC92957.1 hypothetical protein BAUCODRAFT_37871 [Baudoinia panamericana UAMH 10762]
MEDVDDAEDAGEVIQYDEDGEGEDVEDAPTPAQDDEEEDEEEDDAPTITQLPSRRRGRGRGRGGARRSTRSERLDYATPQPHEADDNEASESGTPFRRRRGARLEGSTRARGSRGGFRGRRRGGHAPEPSRTVVDKDGHELPVVDDEVQVDDDAEGNAKVDANGNLLGNREYRVRTFKITGKSDKLYMLSTEPARCCGFRDSYLFFAKHPKLYKVLLTEPQKLDLIDRDILPSSYKGRNIGVVTARSVFREFGARIIVGGRRVVDDYKVAEAREQGEVEGELADPEDHIPDDKGKYNRNRYVAWFGASEVYRNVGQGAERSHKAGAPGQGKKRGTVTVENWQFVHAREASRFNARLTAMRRATLDGVYDSHTNMMFYPKIMQPTHARWEQIPPPIASITNGGAESLPNGTTNNGGPHEDHEAAEPNPSIFPPVPPIISRNFVITDTHLSHPALPSSSGYPGPDSATLDPTSGSNGLTTIPAELVEELPAECRAAFEQARGEETRWKRSWGTEAGSALRGELRVGFSGYPV